MNYLWWKSWIDLNKEVADLVRNTYIDKISKIWQKQTAFFVLSFVSACACAYVAGEDQAILAAWCKPYCWRYNIALYSRFWSPGPWNEKKN